MVMMHRSFVSRREELFTEIYFCSVIIDGMNNCLFINGRINDQSNQSNSRIDKFVRVNFLIFTSNIIIVENNLERDDFSYINYFSSVKKRLIYF